MDWGALARFWVMDTRQYRSDQPCGGGTQKIPCGDSGSAQQTMPGDAQERWLANGLDLDGSERSPHFPESAESQRKEVRWHNNHRGYVSCTVTPAEWRADYQIVEYVSRPDAPKITASSWRCEHGRAGVNKV